METAWLDMFRFITFFMSVGYGNDFIKCQKGKNGELFLELLNKNENDAKKD